MHQQNINSLSSALIGLQQPQHPPQQLQQQQNLMDQMDPIAKSKSLFPTLKETLVKTINDSAIILSSNFQQEANPNEVIKLEKNLEKFYTICDQIEINLKLVAKLINQNVECRRFVPYHIQEQQNTQMPPESIPYAQYVSIVKSQLTASNEINELLKESARRIRETSTITQIKEEK